MHRVSDNFFGLSSIQLDHVDADTYYKLNFTSCSDILLLKLEFHSLVEPFRVSDYISSESFEDV